MKIFLDPMCVYSNAHSFTGISNMCEKHEKTSLNPPSPQPILAASPPPPLEGQTFFFYPMISTMLCWATIFWPRLDPPPAPPAPPPLGTPQSSSRRLGVYIRTGRPSLVLTLKKLSGCRALGGGSICAVQENCCRSDVVLHSLRSHCEGQAAVCLSTHMTQV